MLEIVTIIREFVAILTMIFAGIIAYNIAFRDLKFGRIKKNLEDDYELKKQALKVIKTLIEKYRDHDCHKAIVQHDFLIELENDMKSLYEETQNCNTEISNQTFLLKHFLSNVHKNYNEMEKLRKAKKKKAEQKVHYENMTCYDLIEIVQSELGLIKTLSEKILKFPSFFQVIRPFKNSPIIKDKYANLLVTTNYKKDSYIQFGYDFSNISAETQIFVENILKTHSLLIQYSLFKSFKYDSYIARLLYFNRIYIPLEIRTEMKHPFCSEDNHLCFALVGYNVFSNKIICTYSQIPMNIDIRSNALEKIVQNLFKREKKGPENIEIFDKYINKSILFNSNDIELTTFRMINRGFLELTISKSKIPQLFGENVKYLKKKFSQELKGD